MIFVLALLLCCWSAADHSGISQPASVHSVKLGDPATIQCHIQGSLDRVWYRLTSAKALQFVASFTSRYSHGEFPEDLMGRYSVDADGTNYHLKISRTTWTDVGTYYCGVVELDRVHFGRGTSLVLKGANKSRDSVVQRPPSQSVQPGESVALECSVLHMDRCTAEHTSVMWLKTPKKSPAEIVHWSGSDERRCTGKACVYQFHLKILSSEDAGTFYCVAAACGEVLLGGGTDLDFSIYGSVTRHFGIFSFIVVTALIVFLTPLCLIIIKCQERFPRHTDSKLQQDATWSQCVYYRK